MTSNRAEQCRDTHPTALIALLTIAAAGCGIPVEPAAPENVELNVDATQVIIAWNAPSSWLPLRRHQRQVLDSNATDKRPACTGTGDDEFCYPAAVTSTRRSYCPPEYATSAKRRRQAPQPSGSPGASPGPGQHPACLRLSPRPPPRHGEIRPNLQNPCTSGATFRKNRRPNRAIAVSTGVRIEFVRGSGKDVPVPKAPGARKGNW